MFVCYCTCVCHGRDVRHFHNLVALKTHVRTGMHVRISKQTHTHKYTCQTHTHACTYTCIQLNTHKRNRAAILLLANPLLLVHVSLSLSFLSFARVPHSDRHWHKICCCYLLPIVCLLTVCCRAKPVRSLTGMKPRTMTRKWKGARCTRSGPRAACWIL